MASGVIAFPFELAIYTIFAGAACEMENGKLCHRHRRTFTYYAARGSHFCPASSFGNVKLIYNFSPSRSRVLTFPAAPSSRSFGIF